MAEVSAEEICGKRLEGIPIALIQQIKALKVFDEPSYIEAGRLYNLLKKIKDQFCVYFAPEKERAYEEHKRICDKEKTIIEPITERMGWLEAEMGGYIRRKKQKDVRNSGE